MFEANSIQSLYFYPFGSTKIRDVNYYGITSLHANDWTTNPIVWYYDQEPLIEHNLEPVREFYRKNLSNPNKPLILANSEHSEYKTQLCQKYGYSDWYYFFHGFAALDWYRSYQYVPNLETQFSKVFISLNRLVTQDRSYRLHLVANLIEENLLEYGIVSCQLADQNGTIKTEITSPHSKLSTNARKLIYKNLMPLTDPLVVDDCDPQGYFSADPDIELQQRALWNVVTETIFYQNKQHLTEKIFKPIVARRPFILVGAVNNLAYLKSYGFKTFDRWIDESYDTIEDPDLRIQAITEELAKLCALEPIELVMMYEDMKETLDYNFNHFYGEFKHNITKELLDNVPSFVKFDYNVVLKRLAQ